MKNKKLEEACKLILTVISALDPTEKNTDHYKEFFASKKEEDLLKWFKKFLNNPDDNFYIEVLPYVNEPGFNEIKKAAKILQIPLEEYVTFPAQGGITTQYPVPVGYLQVKRQQQIVAKKNSFASNIRQRNSKTGQVVGASKAARESDMDSYTLQTLGAKNVLRELMGSRADDMTAKNQLYSQLAMQGYSSLSEIESDPTEKIALRTVDMLYLCAGVKTDLITSDLTLPISGDKKAKHIKQV